MDAEPNTSPTSRLVARLKAAAAEATREARALFQLWGLAQRIMEDLGDNWQRSHFEQGATLDELVAARGEVRSLTAEVDSLRLENERLKRRVAELDRDDEPRVADDYPGGLPRGLPDLDAGD